MNVIKDVIFEGRILDQVEKAVDFIKIQMKERTYLGHDGIFLTEEENARIETENARIGDKNARIGDKNARIETQNIWNRVKNDWIHYVRDLKEKGLMTNITAEAIIAVLEDIRENQVIRTKDVQKILDCKDTKALRIITEMKNNKIIVEIAGQGKGKYILNVTD